MKHKILSGGFTLLELLAALAIVSVLAATLSPTLARSGSGSRSAECLKHLRDVTMAWWQQAEDNNGALLTCQDGIITDGASRPNWMGGVLDFNPSNASNWDSGLDLPKSPLWPYVGKNPTVFRCPADPSKLVVNGTQVPRVRSISMSQVFSRGEWLGRTYNTSQKVWRTFSRLNRIVSPGKTFVFLDEHPDSINDGAFANACTGNQPGDPLTISWMIDIPANQHEGGCGISFADGHAQIHQWKGTKLRFAPMKLDATIPLNVWAGDSWVDMHWLAANTTVRN